jgi:hypothetical protein
MKIVLQEMQVKLKIEHNRGSSLVAGHGYFTVETNQDG